MPKRIDVLKERKIIELRNRGLSFNQVARKAKASKATIQRVMKDYGNKNVTDKKVIQLNAQKSTEKPPIKKPNFICRFVCRIFKIFRSKKSV